MVVAPAAIPLTSPVAALTVAIAVFNELQTPFVVRVAKLVFAFTQTAFDPVMGATTGNGFTVTVLMAVAEHPLVPVRVY